MCVCIAETGTTNQKELVSASHFKQMPSMAPTSFAVHRVQPGGQGRSIHGDNVRWAQMGNSVLQTTQIQGS
mgnify:CR=1 FL=1